MKRKTPDDDSDSVWQGPLQLIWQTALDVFEIILEKGYPCRTFVLIGPFDDVARLIEPRVNSIIEGKEAARKNMDALFRRPYNSFEGFLFRSHGPRAYLSMVDMEHFLRGDLHVVSEDEGSAEINYNCHGSATIRINGDNIVESARSLPDYTTERDKRPHFTLCKRFKY